MLDDLGLYGKVALDMIRHRGLADFLRKLPAPRELAALLIPRRVKFGPGQTIMGALDPPRGGSLDRETGLIEGWVLGRNRPIDCVEIRIDGKFAGCARIAVPYPIAAEDMPNAAVSGFRAYLPGGLVADDCPVVRVSAVAHDIAGETRAFAARDMAMKPRSAGEVAIRKPAAPTLTHQTRHRRGSRIRIACFSHDLNYGGAQLFLWEILRRAVGEQSLEFTVFSPKDGPLRPDILALGMRIEQLGEPSRSEEKRHDHDTSLLRNRLLQDQFDCVFANTLQGFYAVNAAAEARIPSIWAIHESFPLPVWATIYSHGRPGREFIRARLAAALERASAVTFVAEATRGMYLPYAPEAHLLRIAYGIDLSSIEGYLSGFDRAAARTRLAIDPGAFVLVCIGNFEARKQQILLAQAFAELTGNHRNILLLMVGELPSLYSAILRRYIQQRRIDRSIRVIPATRETYLWYGVADAFVLLSDVESMPRSLMEAMSFGLPSLATNVYGVSELIEDGRTGFLIQPNSLRSAVNGLEKLLDMPAAKRSAMGAAARHKIATAHDSKDYVATYSSLIKSLVAQGGSISPFPEL